MRSYQMFFFQSRGSQRLQDKDSFLSSQEVMSCVYATNDFAESIYHTFPSSLDPLESSSSRLFAQSRSAIQAVMRD